MVWYQYLQFSSLTYLLTNLLAYLRTYIHACLLAYSFAHLRSYLHSYSLTCSLTCLLTGRAGRSSCLGVLRRRRWRAARATEVAPYGPMGRRWRTKCTSRPRHGRPKAHGQAHVECKRPSRRPRHGPALCGPETRVAWQSACCLSHPLAVAVGSSRVRRIGLDRPGHLI